MHQNAKRSKSGHLRNQSSRIQEDRGAIYFIEPDDEEFKRKMKNACRKLEIPMSAAMPCKTSTWPVQETCRTVGEHETKYACIVEADEPTRIRMEGSHHKNHEDHISGKG